MHYILLKGSNDQGRVAVSQELKRLRKRVKELEEQLEEVQGQYDYECECNKQFVACQKENEKLKQEVNDWKQRFNSSDKWCKTLLQNSVTASELKNKKIEQLKQAQKQLAIKELEKLISSLSNIENTLINCGNGKEDAICWFVKLIDNQIKQLKGESNE